MIEPDHELRIRGKGGFKGQVFRIKVAREGLQNINEEVVWFRSYVSCQPLLVITLFVHA